MQHPLPLRVDVPTGNSCPAGTRRALTIYVGHDSGATEWAHAFLGFVAKVRELSCHDDSRNCYLCLVDLLLIALRRRRIVLLRWLLIVRLLLRRLLYVLRRLLHILRHILRRCRLLSRLVIWLLLQAQAKRRT